MEFVSEVTRSITATHSTRIDEDQLSEASSVLDTTPQGRTQKLFFDPAICDDTASSSNNLEDSVCADPLRQVVCADALKWLESFDDNTLKGSVFTSLPDLSELPTLFHGYKDAEKIAKYKGWFVDTTAMIFRKMVPGQYAIFLQSDIRNVNKSSTMTEWVDKSHLCTTAADRSVLLSAFTSTIDYWLYVHYG
jgi:hypothetical protein